MFFLCLCNVLDRNLLPRNVSESMSICLQIKSPLPKINLDWRYCFKSNCVWGGDQYPQMFSSATRIELTQASVMWCAAASAVSLEVSSGGLRLHCPTTGLQPATMSLVFTRPLLYGARTLWCLSVKMESVAHYQCMYKEVPSDVPQWQLLFSDETWWWIAAIADSA